MCWNIALRLSSKLRLLLDASVSDLLADEICAYSAVVRAERVNLLPIKEGDDDIIVRYAKAHDLIVVTTDTGLNHVSFPVCRHPGIIVLSGRRRHESVHAGLFKKFMQSGNRSYAKDKVTYLTDKLMRIRTHDDKWLHIPL